jgi:drug/metabolite transporter (DMT)-like permease
MLGIALHNTLLNAGQKTVTAGAASFIINTSPLLTALLATVLTNEWLNRWGWLGSALSVGGVSLIAAGQPSALHFGSGTIMNLAAAGCLAAYFVLQGPLVPRYGTLASTAYTLVFAALVLLPWLPGALVTLAIPKFHQ